jgi:hypothetical protein
LGKDERGEGILTDPHKIVNTWKNYFCQLQNVQGASGFTETEIQSAESFVPEPSAGEFEVAIGNLERYMSPGVGQIPAERVRAGGDTLHSEIYKLNKLIWNKDELHDQCKELIVVPLHKKGYKTDCSNY